MKSHFTDVHRKVLRQHAEIRTRLHGLEAEASAAATFPLALRHLRISLRRLSSLFDAHLTYEEQQLPARLHERDPSGALECALFAEHVEQRARLEQICASANDEPSIARELAGDVRWLVMSLLADMASEDRELLALQRLDDNRVERMVG